MSSINPRIRVVGAIAALATIALLASCRGFFPPATLTSMTVGPTTPTIDTGSTNNTVQMFAIGNYNGNTGAAPQVIWSISPSDNSIATLSSTGLVTAVNAGSAVVTATATQNSSITANQTVTVNLGNITALTLDNSTYSIAAPNDTAPAFAYAQTSSGKVDVSSTATWSTANGQVATVQGGSDPVTITGIAQGTTTVTAQYLSAGVTYTATANVTVGP
jgi:hypothetical protein